MDACVDVYVKLGYSHQQKRAQVNLTGDQAT